VSREGEREREDVTADDDEGEGKDMQTFIIN